MLMEKYRDKVFLACSRVSNNRDDAEDLTQEVFVRVWRGLGSFREYSAFSTWLYRISWNVCATYIAEKSKGEALSVYDESEPDEDEKSISYSIGERDKAFDDMENQQLINTVFTRLTEVQRLVLTLYYLKEQSYDEICSITGMPMGSVKATLHRAKEKMRMEVLKEMSAAPSKKLQTT